MQRFPPWPITMKAIQGERVFAIDRSGLFNGGRVDYRAVLAETVIQDAAGDPLATMFSTSYLAKNMGNPANRPVVFIFNGGPGAASGPLHLAGLGPKRLAAISSRDFADPENPLVDNPASPLDVMDLVFIDPVDTGFGASLPNQGNRFRSVDGDSEAVSQFILQWLKTHGRSGSPKYILGESYGSQRAVAVARDLARSEDKVVVDGIILAGFALTFGQNGRVPSPSLVASELPMMASVAWRHGKIDKTQTWEQAVEKARVFARNEYLPALAQGYWLDQATFERIVSRLPGIIGIPESYFRKNRTIAVADFNAELLRSEGLVLDRNNGLETGLAEAERPRAPDAAFERAMERYVAKEFAAASLGPYHLLTPHREDATDWNFTTTGAPALDVSLSELMAKYAGLRLLIAQGRYDTLTDLGTTEYVLSQTDVPADRFSIIYYDGGHMLAMTPEAATGLRNFVLRK